MSKDIPTEEEFAKAFAAIARRTRGLDDLRKIVLDRFSENPTLHKIFFIDTSEDSFYVHVFYVKNQDIAHAKQTGFDKQIEAAVVSELSKIRDVDPSAFNVSFEYDSDENVKENFQGNYYYRLR